MGSAWLPVPTLFLIIILSQDLLFLCSTTSSLSVSLSTLIHCSRVSMPWWDPPPSTPPGPSSSSSPASAFWLPASLRISSGPLPSRPLGTTPLPPIGLLTIPGAPSLCPTSNPRRLRRWVACFVGEKVNEN